MPRRSPPFHHTFTCSRGQRETLMRELRTEACDEFVRRHEAILHPFAHQHPDGDARKIGEVRQQLIGHGVDRIVALQQFEVLSLQHGGEIESVGIEQGGNHCAVLLFFERSQIRRASTSAPAVRFCSRAMAPRLRINAAKKPDVSYRLRPQAHGVDHVGMKGHDRRLREAGRGNGQEAIDRLDRDLLRVAIEQRVEHGFIFFRRECARGIDHLPAGFHRVATHSPAI